jgi:hypothetical protein
MRQRVLCTLVIVPFLLLANAASALEKLTTEELASHCDAYPDLSDSVDGQYCVRYIQGFIDGAIATDVRVMMNIEAASEEREETFTERAFRTRMPSREDNDRAAKYAEFCLGDPVPLAEVVTKVVKDLNSDRIVRGSGLARDVVYSSLRAHYPCQQD